MNRRARFSAAIADLSASLTSRLRGALLPTKNLLRTSEAVKHNAMGCYKAICYERVLGIAGLSGSVFCFYFPIYPIFLGAARMLAKEGEKYYVVHPNYFGRATSKLNISLQR